MIEKYFPAFRFPGGFMQPFMFVGLRAAPRRSCASPLGLRFTRPAPPARSILNALATWE